MSKTIEFVNRKIKDKKDQLKRLEKLKVTSNKYDLQMNELLTKNTEEDIEHLEKIKCELEAWEESKKYFILNEGYVPFYESTYEYITLKNDCIDESNSEEEGISIIKIKKAMEVE